MFQQTQHRLFLPKIQLQHLQVLQVPSVMPNDNQMNVDSDNNGGQPPLANNNPNPNTNPGNAPNNARGGLSADQRLMVRQYKEILGGSQQRILSYRITDAQLRLKTLRNIRVWTADNCQSAVKLIDQEARQEDKVKVLRKALNIQRKFEVQNLRNLKNGFIAMGIPAALLPEVELNDDEMKEMEQEIGNEEGNGHGYGNGNGNGNGNGDGNGAPIQIEGNDKDLQGKVKGLEHQLATLQKFLLGGQGAVEEKKQDGNGGDNKNNGNNDNVNGDKALAAALQRKELLQLMQGARRVPAKNVRNRSWSLFYIQYFTQ